MTDYREITLDDWKLLGEGGTSFNYCNDKDKTIVLKLFKKHFSLDKIEREYIVSKNVEQLGLLVPRVYELVKVGDTYGIIFEKLADKISLAKLCANDSSKIMYYAEMQAEYVKTLHNTKCNPDKFIDKGENFKKIIIDAKLDKNLADKMYKLIDNTELSNTCIHGDINPTNFVISNGKLYMIDFETFGRGNSIYDLASLYFACKSEIKWDFKKAIFHLDRDQFFIYFEAFIKKYFSTNDKEFLDNICIRCKKYTSLYGAILFAISSEINIEKSEIIKFIEKNINEA